MMMVRLAQIVHIIVHDVCGKVDEINALCALVELVHYTFAMRQKNTHIISSIQSENMKIKMNLPIVHKKWQR